MLAGFPCQPFSFAGNRLGFEDTRGTLFFEIARILKEKKPYGFLLENVEGLLNHDKGKTMSLILSSLKNLGYKVTYNLINAEEHGLAQSRKKVYIVGTLIKEISLEKFKKKHVTFKDIQQKNQDIINTEFTQKLLGKYSYNELYGKSIKDKRGGIENIHSWDIELKGKVSEGIE